MTSTVGALLQLDFAAAREQHGREPTAPPALRADSGPSHAAVDDRAKAAPVPAVVAIFAASVPLLPPCCTPPSLSTFWSVPSESTELRCGVILTTFPEGSVSVSMRIDSSA